MSIPTIFDTKRRQTQAARTRPDAFLIEQLALRALDRLAALTKPPRHVAVLGLTPPAFAATLRGHFSDVTLSAARLDEKEQLHVDGAPDVIVDLGQLALTNDVPGLLVQIRRALPPEGLFIGVLFGGETLAGLRQALLQAESELTGGGAPRLHPTLRLEDATALLQRAGFALPVIDTEMLRVSYRDLTGLARDLRQAHLANALIAAPCTIPPRRLFARATELWRAKADLQDARLMALFEIISLTGWTPAP